VRGQIVSLPAGAFHAKGEFLPFDCAARILSGGEAEVEGRAAPLRVLDGLCWPPK